MSLFDDLRTNSFLAIMKRREKRLFTVVFSKNFNKKNTVFYFNLKSLLICVFFRKLKLKSKRIRINKCFFISITIHVSITRKLVLYIILLYKYKMLI